MKKERIGLFGGTFNPLHSGHLKAAGIVQKRFELETVLFIPSYIPPHKQSSEVASPVHRQKMVELALRSHSRFVPSSIEIEAKGRSYSIFTLRKIKKIYIDALIFFILGVDSFLEIDTWKNYEQVLKQCFFIVMSRSGYHLNEAKHILKKKFGEKVIWLPESGVVQEEMLCSYKIFFLPIDALDIASTEIRKRIKRGDSIKGLVSDDVESYIRENNLYQI